MYTSSWGGYTLYWHSLHKEKDGKRQEPSKESYSIFKLYLLKFAVHTNREISGTDTSLFFSYQESKKVENEVIGQRNKINPEIG